MLLGTGRLHFQFVDRLREPLTDLQCVRFLHESSQEVEDKDRVFSQELAILESTLENSVPSCGNGICRLVIGRGLTDEDDSSDRKLVYQIGFETG